MPPPTLDVFLRAVLFELRESFEVTEPLARLLLLSFPEVIAVEYQTLDPTQAARSLVLCAFEEGTLTSSPTMPPSDPPASSRHPASHSFAPLECSRTG